MAYGLKLGINGKTVGLTFLALGWVTYCSSCGGTPFIYRIYNKLVAGIINMKKMITKSSPLNFLSGGGEMGERIRNFDWTTTPLGDPEGWDHGLKTCVRIILTSAQPMFVWWGPSLVNIYNDSYAQFLGIKHPTALG